MCGTGSLLTEFTSRRQCCGLHCAASADQFWSLTRCRRSAAPTPHLHFMARKLPYVTAVANGKTAVLPEAASTWLAPFAIVSACWAYRCLTRSSSLPDIQPNFSDLGANSARSRQDRVPIWWRSIAKVLKCMTLGSPGNAIKFSGWLREHIPRKRDHFAAIKFDATHDLF